MQTLKSYASLLLRHDNVTSTLQTVVSQQSPSYDNVISASQTVESQQSPSHDSVTSTSQTVESQQSPYDVISTSDICVQRSRVAVSSTPGTTSSAAWICEAGRRT
jgi:hypothetical protein